MMLMSSDLQRVIAREIATPIYSGREGDWGYRLISKDSSYCLRY